MFASFTGARFEGPADFNAIRGEQAFDLTNATFEVVPDFIQAHFSEAPRLDNVRVNGYRLEPPTDGASETPPSAAVRLHHALQRRSYGYRRVTMADHDIPARWRALKRLAIQAHDGDREHEFFSREIRSARFATDWLWPLRRPRFTSRRLKWLNLLPMVFWRTEAWAGASRFWFGYVYGWSSNYGRSAMLPLGWWAATLLFAAMFYLGEHPGVASDRALLRDQGRSWPWAWAASTYKAAWSQPEPCYEPANQPPGSAAQPISQHNTSAPNEAFILALRTGLIAFDPGPEGALRTYRCLYGLEEIGGRPMPIISATVSYFMIGQKLFSAVMIFLFGLALRNMLKMK